MQLSKSNKWTVPFYLSAAYITVVLLRPHEYALSPIIDVPILPVLMFAAFLTWFLYGRREFEASQYWLAPLLLAVMCLSMIASGWFGGALVIFRKTIPVIGLFFLIALTADSPARVRMLMKIVAIAAIVMALHGINQLSTGTGWSGAEVIDGRITYVGIFNDPNDLGLLFIATLPVMFHLLTETRSFLWRGLLFFSTGAVLYAIYLTNSRGTILGLLSLIGCYFWARFGLLRTAILISVLGPLAVIFAPSRFREMGGGEVDESALYRFEAWYEGFYMFRDNLFLGVGVERFDEHFFMTAHNSFVIVLSETGFIGSYVWTAFLGLSVYMMYKIQGAEIPPALATDPTELMEFESSRKVARALMYAFIAFCAAALFLSRAYDITLFIWCGLAVAHYQNSRRRWPEYVELINLQGHYLLVLGFWAAALSVCYVGMKVGLSL
jgi:O-antigen ligase